MVKKIADDGPGRAEPVPPKPVRVTIRPDGSRSIATKAAFENAMALDVSMGGSTNTVLHMLAIAREAGVELGRSVAKYDLRHAFRPLR